ncbi:MAG: VWA domain-containing protein [Chloroflexota bacterium]
MTRTRIVFFAIVAVAFFIILATLIVRGIAGLVADNGPAADGNTTQATPLPRDTVLLTVSSSNTKEKWLNQIVERFNAEGHQTAAGDTIIVEATHVTSGGSMEAILNGRSQPVAWSPGDQSWVDQLNQNWQQRENKPLISQSCRPTIYAPLGFAMWQPMAETLGWPDRPVGWETIVGLAADPNGWASYGRPEWGEFRFGHTHPGYANSGLLAMTSFVHGVLLTNEPLTAAQVYQAEGAMRALEQNTAKYGRQSPDILDLMARQGPSYLHAAAVPEADVVRFNDERGDELQFPLAFIFPAGGTIWADHPYCILDNADWVSEAQAEAAAIFADYLGARPQQEVAIDNYLRPTDTTIPLHAPLDLEHGTDPTISPAQIPALPSPDASVSEAVIDLFLITKRKATIVVVLDVSGSMQGDKIKSATAATVEFLGRLYPDDELAVITFNDDVVTLADPRRVGDVVETLSDRVGTLVADGNTALYGAVCEAAALAEQLKAEDEAAGESRLYGIVLLSDGEDTVGDPTETRMFATCLPETAEAEGIKIFPIAFGEDADAEVLSRIASVTGGNLYTANPESISNVYVSISAEQ